MKLKVICDKKDIGTLDVSTYPGPSHSFELNKKRYKILKVEDKQIIVDEITSNIVIDKTSQEVQVKK